MEAMQQPHRMQSYLFTFMTVLTYQLYQSIKSVDKRQSSLLKKYISVPEIKFISVP